MCDTKKFTAIFQEIKSLIPDDTLQLTLQSESESP